MKTTISMAALALVLASTLPAYAGGELHCGPLPGHRAILPNRWMVTPVGRLITVGEEPFGAALSPDGKWLAVSNNGEGEQGITLIPLGKPTGRRPVNVVMKRKEGALYWGLAFSPDSKRLYAAGGGCNRVWVYDLTAKHIGPPQGISVLPQDQVEIAQKQVDPSKYAGGLRPTQHVKNCYPAGLALSADGKELYATDVLEGAVVRIDTKLGKVVARYEVGRYPYAVAKLPGADKLYVSMWADKKVLVLNSETGEKLGTIPAGDHPCAFAYDPNSGLMACANSANDTVTLIDTGQDKAVANVDVAPYAGAPAGSCPNAVAFSRDGKRLYVANAGNNDVAVVDVAERKVVGLIPTAWYPAAVSISADGGRLFVVSAKGYGCGPNMPPTRRYLPTMLHGIVSILPVPSERMLAEYTRRVRANDDLDARAAGTKRPACAVPATLGEPSPIKHVLYIIKENRTYDQVFGDIGKGNSDPALTLFGEKVTPNEHALARQFVLLDNLYCDSSVSVDGHEWCKAANVTDAVEKTWPANYGRRCPLVGSPVYSPTAGHIWDDCRRAGKTSKIYWGIIGLHRDQKVADQVLKTIDEGEKTGDLPDLMVIHLPCDHTMGTTPGRPTPRAMNADNDLALGRIVAGLSKSRFWKDSVVFSVEDDAQDGPDHVDAHRTIAMVAGPYVRRGIIDSTMYDQCSIVRTIELILGLQPMSQFDASATPMYACFSDKANLSGYKCRAATWPTGELNKATAWGAKESAAMDFSAPDLAPFGELNQVLWHSIKGANTPYPTIVASRRSRAAEEDDD